MPASTHIHYWQNQEGHLVRSASMHLKSLALHTGTCLSLCNEGVHDSLISYLFRGIWIIWIS